MMDNLISIIVPAYNIKNYIERCVESILHQTYQTLEIIIVDDGSTDGTSQVLDEIAQRDDRIKVIHKENGGVSSARITGIKNSTGEYIGFVDGDDFIESGMFENLLNNAVKYEADISHCGYQMVFPNGRVDLYYGTGSIKEHDNIEGLKALVKGDYIEPALWNKLFRRELLEGFEKSMLWDESIKINEDLLMNYILFSKARNSIYQDVPYYHYILRKGSAATSKISLFKIKDPLNVAQKIYVDSFNNEELHVIALERYMRNLIGVTCQTEYKSEAACAKKKLRDVLSEARNVNNFNHKVYLMAFAAAYMTIAYKVVRSIYNKRTGLEKKYNLD